MRHLLASAAAFAVLGFATTASAQTWTDWGVADVTPILTALGGEVVGTSSEGGEVLIISRFAGWLVVSIGGDSCTGPAEALRCRGMILTTEYDINDEPRARWLEETVNNRYLAEAVIDGDYVVVRDVDLTGGALKANVEAQIYGFLVANDLVAQTVFPDPIEPSE